MSATSRSRLLRCAGALGTIERDGIGSSKGGLVEIGDTAHLGCRKSAERMVREFRPARSVDHTAPDFMIAPATSVFQPIVTPLRMAGTANRFRSGPIRHRSAIDNAPEIVTIERRNTIGGPQDEPSKLQEQISPRRNSRHRFRCAHPSQYRTISAMRQAAALVDRIRDSRRTRLPLALLSLRF